MGPRKLSSGDSLRLREEPCLSVCEAARSGDCRLGITVRDRCGGAEARDCEAGSDATCVLAVDCPD